MLKVFGLNSKTKQLYCRSKQWRELRQRSFAPRNDQLASGEIFQYPAGKELVWVGLAILRNMLLVFALNALAILPERLRIGRREHSRD